MKLGLMEHLVIYGFIPLVVGFFTAMFLYHYRKLMARITFIETVLKRVEHDGYYFMPPYASTRGFSRDLLGDTIDPDYVPIKRILLAMLQAQNLRPYVGGWDHKVIVEPIPTPTGGDTCRS